MVIWNSPVGFPSFPNSVTFTVFLELYCTRARRNFSSFSANALMISAGGMGGGASMVSVVVTRRTSCSVAGGGVNGPASCAFVNVAHAIASIAAKIALPSAFILPLYFSGFMFNKMRPGPVWRPALYTSHGLRALVQRL